MLGMLQKMTTLLTKRNLKLLDVVLQGILDEKADAAPAFWQWVNKQMPTADSTHAYTALAELRKLLAAYRNSGKLKR